MKFQVIARDRNCLSICIYIPRLFFSWLFPEMIELNLDKAADLVLLRTRGKILERSLSEISACEIDRPQQLSELILWGVKDDGLYGKRFLGERIRIARGRERQLTALKECIETFWSDRAFKIIDDGCGTWIAYRTEDYLELHYETLRQPGFTDAVRTHYCEVAYSLNLNLKEFTVTMNTLNCEGSGKTSRIVNHSNVNIYPLDSIEGWYIERDDDGDERILLKLRERDPIAISRWMDYVPTSATQEKQYGGYGPAKFAINTLKDFCLQLKKSAS